MNPIRLIVEVYAEKDPNRAAELERALAWNLNNNHIDKVFCVGDASLEPVLRQKYGDTSKLVYVPSSTRATFKSFLSIANDITLSPFDIAILCNSDISFDDTLKALKTISFPNHAMALARWEDGKVNDRPDSQDAWIFQGKIRPVVSDYKFGICGCDNRFAYELEAAGYIVINPSLTIKATHHHHSQVRYYDRAIESVPPPYRVIGLCELPSFPASNHGHVSVSEPVKPITASQLPSAGTPSPISNLQSPVSKSRERVLHISMNGEDALQRALAGLGDYVQVEWRKEFGSGGEAGRVLLKKAVLAAAKNLDPTITFIQLQTGDVLDPGVLDRWNGCKLNWTGDVRVPILPFFHQFAPHCSATCFTNVDQVEELRKAGHASEYLQNAVDPEIFKPEGPKVSDYDIIWMGNEYENWFPLSQLRRDMVRMLKQRYGKRFGAFGSRVLDADGNLNNDMHAEAAHYRGCKIALNVSHFALRRYSSDRLYRAMGSGAFVLTHAYPEFYLDFDDGYHLVTWNSLEELINRIDYYLDRPEEREQIARLGRDRVHLRHTWQRRAAEMLQIRDKYNDADRRREQNVASRLPRYLVMAGDRRQYDHWLNIADVHPREAIMIEGQHHIDMFDPKTMELIFVGTWHMNPLHRPVKRKQREMDEAAK